MQATYESIEQSERKLPGIECALNRRMEVIHGT